MRVCRNIRVFRKIIITWIILGALIAVALHFNLDKKFIAIGLIFIGFFTQAFSGLLVLIGLAPWVGPLLVKVLSLPFFWLLNGIGYLASVIAIRKGHGKVVLNHRIVTIVLLIGVILGYVLGRVLH
ncbi:hypothetical protein ACFL6I_28850 [candidate division KSB1 bacterium]